MYLSTKQLIFIIVLAIVFGGFCGFLISQYWPGLLPEKPSDVFIPMIFKEGSEGDFKLKIEKEEDDIFLSWPEGIKAAQIQVYDLGNPEDSEDHQLIFFATNFSLNSDEVEASIPLLLERFYPMKELPGKMVKPKAPETDVYLTSPYQIGVVPEGFFDYTPEKVKPIFKKDHRYLIVIGAIEKEENRAAEYFFVF